ncbi:MAG: hypothetical protein FJ034_05360 [Chloroflexi bacterium]|nr:hypothetical protein [Chloroflexota bacterium]
MLALYILLTQGTTPIGGALVGFMAEAWGIQVAMTVVSGVSLSALAIIWLALRKRLPADA